MCERSMNVTVNVLKGKSIHGLGLMVVEERVGAKKRRGIELIFNTYYS